MDKNDVERAKKRAIIIETAYKLFTKKGLEKTSIRDIANLTEMNLNTIYYYFRTKAEIVICCVEYGLERISRDLFGLAQYKRLDDDNFFSELLDYSLINKDQFCWCYQVITSPNYNWLMKDILFKTRKNFDKYILEMAQKNNLEFEKLKNLIGIVILIIKDYMISEDENCKTQMKFISNQLNELVQVNKNNRLRV